MKIRPYQREAIDALYAFFTAVQDPMRNPVIALPTGTGKSVVIAGFISEVMKRWPNQRIMMLTHVKELIAQNADKMTKIWPQAPLGIFSAGLKQKQAHMPITFAGVQSAIKSFGFFGKQDILIIDECHLVGTDENASYLKFIAMLREKNPWLRVIGLSATPYRLGLGMITDGGIFTDVVYDGTGLSAFNMFLDEGYLAPLIPMPTETIFDVSKVGTRGGEFIQGALQKAMTKRELSEEAVRELMIAAQNRHSWLIFTTGVEHAEMVADLLRLQGVPTGCVHSKMKGKRDEEMQAFDEGHYRALVNSDILTTGYDKPDLDCIVDLKPTQSPGLHVQKLGRGTRPYYAPGFDLDTTEGRLNAIAASTKQNCLVLDFAGNTRRLGPINAPRLPSRKGEGTGDVPVKACKECGCLHHISARFCINCEAEFVFQEKIEGHASTLALIMRDEPAVEVFDVDRVTYRRHARPGHIPSLCVTYHCGMRSFTQYVCIQHPGNIRFKAIDWWRKRTTIEFPVSVTEALKYIDILPVPDQIRVWVNKQFPEVLAELFTKDPNHFANQEPQ